VVTVATNPKNERANKEDNGWKGIGEVKANKLTEYAGYHRTQTNATSTDLLRVGHTNLANESTYVGEEVVILVIFKVRHSMNRKEEGNNSPYTPERRSL